MIDTEILEDYGSEARELLDEMSHNLIRLKKEGGSDELLDNIFHAVHCVKGAAEYIGLERSGTLTQGVENLLDRLREGAIGLTGEVVAFLFRAKDLINTLISEVSQYHMEKSEISGIMEELDRLLRESSDERIQVRPSGLEPFTSPEASTVTIDPRPGMIPQALPVPEEECVPGWEKTVDSTDHPLEHADGEKTYKIEEKAFVAYPEAHVPELKSLPVSRPAGNRSLLADVDDALLRELDEISGDGHGGQQPHDWLSQDAKSSQAADLLATLDAIGTEGEPTGTGMGQVTAASIAMPDFGQEGVLVSSMTDHSRKVDVLLGQVGELGISRSDLERLSTELNDFQRLLMTTDVITRRELALIKDLTLKAAEANASLGRVANNIQESVTKLRMAPVSQLFNQMRPLIGEFSRRAGKVVNLEVCGGDTEVDKSVIDQMYNPLAHLIRNAVDHGIEDIEARKRLGKSNAGTVILRAYSEGNTVVIDVEDDGTGIDKAAVLHKAVKSRLVDSQHAESISPEEIYNFLFLPGFCRSCKASRASGQGVGMDVVKKDIEKINARIRIESWEDQGTRISLKIPLELAIIRALLIGSGRRYLAIPLTSIREIVRTPQDEIETIEGIEVVKFRDETIPVLRIPEVFNLKREEGREANFLIIAVAGVKTVGFLVEGLVGEQNVVIQPLAEHVCEIRGFAGATILGDGTIALVMDVTEIVDDITSQRRQPGIQGSPSAIGDSVNGMR